MKDFLIGIVTILALEASYCLMWITYDLHKIANYFIK